MASGLWRKRLRMPLTGLRVGGAMRWRAQKETLEAELESNDLKVYEPQRSAQFSGWESVLSGG